VATAGTATSVGYGGYGGYSSTAGTAWVSAVVAVPRRIRRCGRRIRRRRRCRRRRRVRPGRRRRRDHRTPRRRRRRRDGRRGGDRGRGRHSRNGRCGGTAGAGGTTCVPCGGTPVPVSVRQPVRSAAAARTARREHGCTSAADCGTGQVCADGLCQTPSTSAGQCVLRQRPRRRAKLHQRRRHALPRTPAAGPNDRCMDGVCQPDVGPRPQCRANADCPADFECVNAVSQDPCATDVDCCAGTARFLLPRGRLRDRERERPRSARCRRNARPAGRASTPSFELELRDPQWLRRPPALAMDEAFATARAALTCAATDVCRSQLFNARSKENDRSAHSCFGCCLVPRSVSEGRPSA
jgi:hypothetical protein